MKLKSGDEHAFPLCHGPDGCHMQFHGKRGRFKNWTKDQRKLWERSMADLYRPSLEERKDSKDEAPDDSF